MWGYFRTAVYRTVTVNVFFTELFGTFFEQFRIFFTKRSLVISTELSTVLFLVPTFVHTLLVSRSTFSGILLFWYSIFYCSFFSVLILVPALWVVAVAFCRFAQQTFCWSDREFPVPGNAACIVVTVSAEKSLLWGAEWQTKSEIVDHEYEVPLLWMTLTPFPLFAVQFPTIASLRKK